MVIRLVLGLTSFLFSNCLFAQDLKLIDFNNGYRAHPDLGSLERIRAGDDLSPRVRSHNQIEELELHPDDSRVLILRGRFTSAAIQFRSEARAKKAIRILSAKAGREIYHDLYDPKVLVRDGVRGIRSSSLFILLERENLELVRMDHYLDDEGAAGVLVRKTGNGPDRKNISIPFINFDNGNVAHSTGNPFGPEKKLKKAETYADLKEREKERVTITRLEYFEANPRELVLKDDFEVTRGYIRCSGENAARCLKEKLEASEPGRYELYYDYMERSVDRHRTVPARSLILYDRENQEESWKLLTVDKALVNYVMDVGERVHFENLEGIRWPIEAIWIGENQSGRLRVRIQIDNGYFSDTISDWITISEEASAEIPQETYRKILYRERLTYKELAQFLNATVKSASRDTTDSSFRIKEAYLK